MKQEPKTTFRALSNYMKIWALLASLALMGCGARVAKDPELRPSYKSAWCAAAKVKDGKKGGTKITVGCAPTKHMCEKGRKAATGFVARKFAGVLEVSSCYQVTISEQ